MRLHSTSMRCGFMKAIFFIFILEHEKLNSWRNRKSAESHEATRFRKWHQNSYVLYAKCVASVCVRASEIRYPPVTASRQRGLIHSIGCFAIRLNCFSSYGSNVGEHFLIPFSGSLMTCRSNHCLRSLRTNVPLCHAVYLAG